MKHVLFEYEGTTRVLLEEEIFKVLSEQTGYGIVGQCRIGDDVYANIPRGRYFVHFNRRFNGADRPAPPLRSIVVMPRIVKRGGVSREPVLSFDSVLLAQCFHVYLVLPYSLLNFAQLGPEVMTHFAKPDDVLDAMFDWYGGKGDQSGPTREELHREGVSQTRFELLGKVSLKL